MGNPRGPVELEAATCRELLASGGTGRIGVSTPLGPQVIPVSYVVLGDAVVLWTSPFSILARCAPGTVVAFEVDHVDPIDRQSWCVQARGRADRLDDPELTAELAELSSPDPEPWAERGRRLYLRVRWTELTGRALGVHRAGTPRSTAADAVPRRDGTKASTPGWGPRP